MQPQKIGGNRFAKPKSSRELRVGFRVQLSMAAHISDHETIAYNSAKVIEHGTKILQITRKVIVVNLVFERLKCQIRDALRVHAAAVRPTEMCRFRTLSAAHCIWLVRFELGPFIMARHIWDGGRLTRSQFLVVWSWILSNLKLYSAITFTGIYNQEPSNATLNRNMQKSNIRT